MGIGKRRRGGGRGGRRAGGRRTGGARGNTGRHNFRTQHPNPHAIRRHSYHTYSHGNSGITTSTEVGGVVKGPRQQLGIRCKIFLFLLLFGFVGIVLGMTLGIIGGMTNSSMGVAGMAIFISTTILVPCSCICLGCACSCKSSNNASVTNAEVVATVSGGQAPFSVGQTPKTTATPGIAGSTTVPQGAGFVNPTGAPEILIFPSKRHVGQGVPGQPRISPV